MATLAADINREHAACVLAQLSQQRTFGNHCDVCVCVSENRFLAHKCVLSANSDKLNSLIVEASSEGGGMSNDIEIEIQGISAIGFEILLNFFYSGILSLEPNTVSHTWMTAAYLGLSDIVGKCNTYCEQSFSSHTVASPTNLQVQKYNPPNSQQKQVKKIVQQPSPAKTIPRKVNVNNNRRLSKKQQGVEVMQQDEVTENIPNKTNTTWHETVTVPHQQQAQHNVQAQLPPHSQPHQIVLNINSSTPNQVWEQPRTHWQNDPSNRDQSSVARREPMITSTESSTMADESSASPVSYTTLSLVSQQPQDSTQEIIQEEHAPEPMNIESVHFPQTNSRMIQDVMTDGQNAVISQIPSTDEAEPMILQVQQLRFQQQQLQQMHNIGKVDESQNNDEQQQVSTSKRKRKAPTKISKSEDVESSDNISKAMVVRRSRSLVVMDQMPHVTQEYMDELYRKYPDVKREMPTVGTNDVTQLFQRGKARQRKSPEQNALNNTVRSILDTTKIFESSDPRVPDAVCLIMDRFQALRDNINDRYIRKQLTLKIKHSIHCKKWRLKRQSLNDKKSVDSISKDEDPKPTTREIRQSWLTDANNTNTTIVIDPLTASTGQTPIEISENS